MGDSTARDCALNPPCRRGNISAGIAGGRQIYTDVEPWALITHLQRPATGRHTFNLLALMAQVRQYHMKHEGVPEYINALEDAQKMAALSDESN